MALAIFPKETGEATARVRSVLDNFEGLARLGRLKNVDQILSDLDLTNLEKVSIKRYAQNHNGNMSPVQLKTYISTGIGDALRQKMEQDQRQSHEDQSKPPKASVKRSVTNSALVALVSKPRTVQVVRSFGLHKQRPV
jgi:hypothetical protein